jgi:hypothetical protein
MVWQKEGTDHSWISRDVFYWIGISQEAYGPRPLGQLISYSTSDQQNDRQVRLRQSYFQASSQIFQIYAFLDQQFLYMTQNQERES